MNVIVIHGSFGKPFENWFPWLEEKMSKLNIECIIPSFPTPEKQEYDYWEELFNYYYKIGKIDSNSIIIGHSCGAAFAAKYIARKKIIIKAIVTVAGYNNFHSGDELMDSLNKSFYSQDETLSIISKLANIRISFISENDPYIPIDVLKHFADIIQSQKIIVPTGGHFNSSAGYNSFDDLYNEIEKILC